MPKKNKFQSGFRVTWNSAKRAADPAVLKLCDFSKGLGPLVDKVALAWDKAADKDPIPPKEAAALADMVKKAQAKIESYAKQILAGNQKHPQHGNSWYSLYKALEKLDTALTEDCDDIGVKVAAIGGWAAKTTFERKVPEGVNEELAKQPKQDDPEGEEIDKQDKQKAYERYARAYAAKKDDIPAALGEWAKKNAMMWLPFQPQLAMTIANYAGGISREAKKLDSTLAKQPYDKEEGMQLFVRMTNIITQLKGELPSDATPVRKTLDDVLREYDKRMAKAEMTTAN